jgi:hypothetical protein
MTIFAIFTGNKPRRGMMIHSSLFASIDQS